MKILPELHPRTLAIMLMVGALGAAAVIPYFLAVFPVEHFVFGYWPTMALLIFLSTSLSLVVVYIGLQWGERIGLGAPRVQNWAWDRADPGGWGLTLAWAIPLGFAAGAVIFIAERYWYAGRFIRDYELSLGWEVVGAVIFAGTAEELLLRLFAMSGIARLLMRFGVLRQRAIVTALFIAAGLSVAFHAPAILQQRELTATVLSHGLFHYGGAGLVYGWLYWRRGIEAAMVAHGLSDVTLRVLLRALAM